MKYVLIIILVCCGFAIINAKSREQMRVGKNAGLVATSSSAPSAQTQNDLTIAPDPMAAKEISINSTPQMMSAKLLSASNDATQMQSVESISADKQASMDRRAAQPSRPPSNPLDQGDDACPGYDLGSALGSPVASGTTVGYANNFGPFSSEPSCWSGFFDTGLAHSAPDVAYQWTVPYTGSYTFSTCPNTYDTGISLWNYTCPTTPVYPVDFICGNDDGGPCGVSPTFGSQIDCLPLTNDQVILIVIDGWNGATGAYDLHITACDCEDNCINNENEPVCYDEYDDVTNGGCNSDPAVVDTLTESWPLSICGETGTFLTDAQLTRDTDWFVVFLADDQFIRWSFVGERANDLFVVGPGPAGFECDLDSIPIHGSAAASACDTIILQGCLPAGEYWFFVGADFDASISCGTDYSFTIDSLPCCESEFSSVIDCAGASPAITGNTIGAPDACHDGFATDVWEIEVLEDSVYTFSMCGQSSWDAVLWISDECCGEPLLFNDDGCGLGNVSTIECRNLNAGTYYLHVSGYSVSDAGAYSIAVSCCASPVYQIVNAMDYRWDDPNGVGIALTVMDPDDKTSVSAAIDVSSLSVGTHTLFVRSFSVDDTGGVKISAVTGRRVVVTPPIAEEPLDLSEMEFYYDTDPGNGNGESVDIPDANSARVSLAHLISLYTGVLGQHTFYARFKTSDNRWGASVGRNFFVTRETADTTVHIEGGFFNIAAGGALLERDVFFLCPLDGEFDELEEECVAYVPADMLPEGFSSRTPGTIEILGAIFNDSDSSQSCIVVDSFAIGEDLDIQFVAGLNATGDSILFQWMTFPATIEYQIHYDSLAGGNYSNYVVVLPPDTSLAFPLPPLYRTAFFRVIAIVYDENYCADQAAMNRSKTNGEQRTQK